MTPATTVQPARVAGFFMPGPDSLPAVDNYCGKVA